MISYYEHTVDCALLLALVWLCASTFAEEDSLSTYNTNCVGRGSNFCKTQGTETFFSFLEKLRYLPEQFGTSETLKLCVFTFLEQKEVVCITKKAIFSNF